jgi:hypothetical protein
VNLRPNTRLEVGNHFADIIINLDDPDNPIYHWIIQKQGSTEILQFGQCLSFEEAESTAKENLYSILKSNQRQGLA